MPHCMYYTHYVPLVTMNTVFTCWWMLLLHGWAMEEKWNKWRTMNPTDTPLTKGKAMVTWQYGNGHMTTRQSKAMVTWQFDKPRKWSHDNMTRQGNGHTTCLVPNWTWDFYNNGRAQKTWLSASNNCEYPPLNTQQHINVHTLYGECVLVMVSYLLGLQTGLQLNPFQDAPQSSLEIGVLLNDSGVQQAGVNEMRRRRRRSAC